MEESDERELRRRAALEAFGAAGPVIEELLAYGEPLLGEGRAPEDPATLGDEPQVAAWSRYAEEAGRDGAVAALARVFGQLRFPIRAGVSATESYRAAARRGEMPDAGDPEATGLGIVAPELVTLEVSATLAGRVPFLVAGERADFESLVRALSARNEPVPVPASMGACLVRGLPNWDRVRTYRAAWEAANPLLDWDTGFSEMLENKELYEDRFILLSSGPYSGVGAGEAGFPADDWRRLSLAIRREHEATHYLTLRAAGTMRTNLLDELIADWAALESVLARYDERLALLFFGLENFPEYREGGRLQNYRGALSDAAFAVVKPLVHAAVRALARADASLAPDERRGPGLARRVLRLAATALDELASDDPPAGEGVRLAIPAGKRGITTAMRAFDTFARDRRLPDLVAANLRLVLDEILSNQIKYGWDGPGGHVSLRFERTPGAVELEFVDDGRPFDVLAAREPDIDSGIFERPIGGLGILLVKRLTDEQSYERFEGKNRLLVRKRI